MTSAVPVARKPLRAIGYRLSSVALIAFAYALIRKLGPEWPLGQLVFFRALIAVLLLSVFYGIRGEIVPALRSSRPWSHFVRAFSGAVSMTTYMVALVRLPLADVTVLGYSTPLMIVALAAIVLKEKIRAYLWSVVVIGFLGVVFMLWPYLSFSRVADSTAVIGALFALLSAVAGAIQTIQVRRLVRTETTASIVFHFYFFLGVGALFTLPFAWKTPLLHEWGIILTIGVLGALSQIVGSESYRYAEASLTAPFDYSAIIMAFVIGYFFLGEVPDPQVYAGAAIIVGAGLFIVWRESPR